MKTAAIYARVSSDQQREEKTIASQTAALVEFARKEGYQVPDEWVFEDEGFSGATLVRPGLERVRDLAAEGHIQAVLALSPDRLSRKYAYQVLLVEELARHGVDMVFIKAPHSDTPEDQLLLQFQGMIAEYERAQILERSRRGKRHRAKQGEVSVLSGAPYGYRYVRKTDEAAAYYETVEAEAEVVRTVFELYTAEGLSIGAVTRRLNELGLPTRKQRARWDRSTVWAMLRNPAYRGKACFGKTASMPRQRVTRALRLRGCMGTRDSSSHDRPREEWIEIPVPALVSEETFALAQENLDRNKLHGPRRTIEPSILQGLVHCRQCGYALYRSSTHSSARKIYYYRCTGSDAYRHAGKAVCDQKPIRQDMLDPLVWSEVLRLLEDPALIQNELDRRLESARQSAPAQRRLETLGRELVRVRNNMERLLTAYQEELLSLDELRARMPPLRKREQAMQAELQALNAQTADRAACLRLAETLTAFLDRLRSHAQTLDVGERQRIVRLLVKEVIVGKDSITIKHSIPGHSAPSPGNPGPSNPSGQSNTAQPGKSYPLRPWSSFATSGKSAYVPLKFELGEAFQFDWSEEWLMIGGVHRKIQAAHTKLCASRAFFLSGYPTQTHEMLYDAHTRAFIALGGVPRRGIYDNMKTAVDKVVKRTNGRVVNSRFYAMTAHYLFEPDFCNVASGWEKGIVEKNVQDSRRRVWIEAKTRCFDSFEELNAWLDGRCRALWSEIEHPHYAGITLAEALGQEHAYLMPMPTPFDGYVEIVARVSSTSLVAVDRNQYSAPCHLANSRAAIHLYSDRVDLYAEDALAARHKRLLGRDQVSYDWQHYIPLIGKKPGALRNGAPFADMPPLFAQLQTALRHRERQQGDRIMAKVLAAVPTHGLEAVLQAVKQLLDSGVTSIEQVVNALSRLNGLPVPARVETTLKLIEEPLADTARYDSLNARGVSHA